MDLLKACAEEKLDSPQLPIEFWSCEHVPKVCSKAHVG